MESGFGVAVTPYMGTVLETCPLCRCRPRPWGRSDIFRGFSQSFYTRAAIVRSFLRGHFQFPFPVVVMLSMLCNRRYSQNILALKMRLNSGNADRTIRCRLTCLSVFTKGPNVILNSSILSVQWV
jgi:hypothetical protein